ncbi:peptide MFS transporter [Henriciella mobilis]|uniref:MFS transporter n=1 Tax=Henriciella mobilis TaxID=2305467 RepID=A0A399REL2_9PROT|nr:peptide MFS transporter [Henriciella mobilis]RIJ15547.1 MFS transporter [Henriciella mobilis]RIJ19011.1 MFS transporter [Henriciella mobilis]RIJ27999.1 MFS transporter [Henriciella mobilis]
MSDATADGVSVESDRPTILGHPRGLVILFFAEMWERFSYYGMRGLLILYLTWHFLFESDFSLTLYGAYVALVYLGPLLGGYLADKYIGFRKAVTFGAILLVIGHGLMGFHGPKASEAIVIDGTSYELTRMEYDESQSRNIVVDGAEVPILTFEQPEKGSDIRNISYETDGGTVTATGTIERVQSPLYSTILFLALAFIVAGVGFLKPNISTCVGALYEEGDRRRDAGFTIYYMGINLGSFLAGIFCAIAAATLGWWAGFGLAAVGMLAGLIVFVIGQDWLEGRAEPPADVDLKTPVVAGINREWLVYLSGFAFVIVAFFLLQIAGIMSLAMHGVFAVVTTGIVIYMLAKLEPVARDKMIGLLILIVSSVLFWALFDQGPSSLNLFAAAHVTNEIGGWEFPAPVLQSANPLFIIIFAPIIAALWTFLGKRGKEPNAFFKFGLAMVQIGAGFYVLNLGIAGASEGADGTIKISVIFIVLMYLLHTTGEVFLSPVGLSAVTKLSVKTIVGFMMGFWFLASSYANVIAAQVARATQVPEGAPAQQSIDAYSAVYAQLGTAAVALGIVLLVASPWLRKLTHGADGSGPKERRGEVDAAGVTLDRSPD